MAVVDTLEIQVTGEGIQALVAAMNSLASSMAGVTAPATKATKDIDKIGKAASEASAKTGGLTSKLAKMAKTMLMRTAIRAFFSAMKEGLEAVYHYSKAISEDDDVFGGLSGNLDALASAWETLKLQMGAAFGELLSGAAPFITYLINGLTTIFEWLTKIFAYLKGDKGYYRAVAATKSMYENTESGAKAAKEWKNQLMGFDEINRLEYTKSSGSGTNTDSEDWSTKYEWVEFDEPFSLKQTLDKIAGWFDELGSRVGGFFDSVAEWVAEATGQVSAFGEGVRETSNAVSSLNPTPQTSGITTASSTAVSAFNRVSTSATTTASDVVTSMHGIDSAVSSTMSSVEGATSARSQAAAGAFAVSLQRMLSATNANLSPVAALFNTIFSRINSVVNGNASVFSNWGSKVRTACSNAWSAVSSFFSRLKSSSSSSSSSYNYDGYEYYDSSSWLSLSSVLSSVSSAVGAFSAIPAFASGGFPTQGQLFVANEAGPELVGTMNGHTAVASNGEITGISSAVYAIGEAIVSAINSKDMSVELDGRELAERMHKYNSNVSSRLGGSLLVGV